MSKPELPKKWDDEVILQFSAEGHQLVMQRQNTIIDTLAYLMEKVEQEPPNARMIIIDETVSKEQLEVLLQDIKHFNPPPPIPTDLKEGLEEPEYCCETFREQAGVGNHPTNTRKIDYCPFCGEKL